MEIVAVVIGALVSIVPIILFIFANYFNKEGSVIDKIGLGCMVIGIILIAIVGVLVSLLSAL
jgi:hypothetical protein